MKNIRIEKVGDINCTYPYLEIFQEGESSPFLEISVIDSKELNFTLWPVLTEVKLTLDQYEKILTTAKEFMPEVIKDEEDFQKTFPI
ncbi:hypothetical protein GK091_24525 [Spirosoma agri]|uniref:Uncharacterized protein n=1 Tax=Spirosoma agri TaxID=1987381 RepID=A0A6M0IRE8_9BACT|nr:hypothetical protein [Spirosoma agri]NEU70065.1 hypothetical protein [Spirosoma agri]